MMMLLQGGNSEKVTLWRRARMCLTSYRVSYSIECLFQSFLSAGNKIRRGVFWTVSRASIWPCWLRYRCWLQYAMSLINGTVHTLSTRLSHFFAPATGRDPIFERP